VKAADWVEGGNRRTMEALRGERLLDAWAAGRGQHDLRRALTLLTLTLPETTHGALAAFPIFERDRLLLRLRILSFGSSLQATATCPGCAETVEFLASVTSILGESESLAPESTLDWVESGTRLRLRAVTTLDLLASLEAPDVETAEDILLSRCLSVDDAFTDVASWAQTPGVRAQFERLHSPMDVSFALTCPHCSHHATLSLNVPHFVWLEVQHAAKTLLGDIDVLASRYGWSERDIVNMPPRRRAAYLELSAT